MAPLLFRDMKGANFSCASPASAAICSSIDRKSIVSPSNRYTRERRSTDRRSHHLREQPKRVSITNHLSQSVSKPKTYIHKSRKSTEKPDELISPPGTSSRYLLNDTVFLNVFPDSEPVLAQRLQYPKRDDLTIQTQRDESPKLQHFKRDELALIRSSSSTILESPRSRFRPIKRDESAVIRPTSSAMIPIEPPRLQPPKLPSSTIPAILPPRLQLLKRDESTVVLRQSSSSRMQDQVVVLRVSLHCKGCEGKVRKHISKMEGVTSFNIDMATKKVTVVGNVTPLGVLNSVSKVKSAQFWAASPPRASASF